MEINERRHEKLHNCTIFLRIFTEESLVFLWKISMIIRKMMKKVSFKDSFTELRIIIIKN